MSLPTGNQPVSHSKSSRFFVLHTIPFILLVYNLHIIHCIHPPPIILLVPYQYWASLIFVSLVATGVSSMLLAIREESQMDEYLKRLSFLPPSNCQCCTYSRDPLLSLLTSIACGWHLYWRLTELTLFCQKEKWSKYLKQNLFGTLSFLGLGTLPKKNVHSSSEDSHWAVLYKFDSRIPSTSSPAHTHPTPTHFISR